MSWPLPLSMVLSSWATAGPSAFIRAGAGPWQPIAVETTGETVAIRINPSQTEAGRAMLLIDPPPHMDIDDATPPAITGLWIDRKPRTPALTMWLGRGNWQPASVAFIARDGENHLAHGSSRCEVDGRALSPTTMPSRLGTLYLAYGLPRLDYGRHTVRFSVADDSPQANRGSLSLSWERYDPSNLALAASGTKLSADSFFSGYPDLSPLQDGKTDLPGDHCQNDISWASAETATPHWVDVDLGRARRIHEVTLYWALYGGSYHAARRWQVQIPGREGWRVVWAASADMEPAKLTTASFPPVVTQRVRVVQAAGGGAPDRPNLMWLAEVMVR